MTLEEFKKFCLDNFVGHFDSDDDDMFNNDETGPTGSPVGPHRFACYGYWKGSDKKGYQCDNILLWCGKGKKDLERFRKYIEDDAPRIHFKKNRKWYADADKIVDAYGLQPKDNKVVFFFEKKGIKI